MNMNLVYLRRCPFYKKKALQSKVVMSSEFGLENIVSMQQFFDVRNELFKEISAILFVFDLCLKKSPDG